MVTLKPIVGLIPNTETGHGVDSTTEPGSKLLIRILDLYRDINKYFHRMYKIY